MNCLTLFDGRLPEICSEPHPPPLRHTSTGPSRSALPRKGRCETAPSVGRKVYLGRRHL